MKKKNFQCAMVETKDHRKFFTHEKNAPLLVEFSKTFGADISIVRVEEAEVLSLQALAPAICDATYDKPITNFKVLGKAPKRSRDKMRTNAQQIRGFIHDQFVAGKVVELDKVAKRFVKLDLTRACFCNHISAVRENLTKAGYKFQKMGGGKYRMEEPIPDLNLTW